MTDTEQTLLIIKPEPEKIKMPGLLFRVGNFIKVNKFEICFEAKAKPSVKFWEQFYSVHREKLYFREMMQYLMRDESHFILHKGPNAIITTRQFAFDTRASYGIGKKDTETGLHTSDSQENFQRENDYVISLFFQTC